MVVMSMGKTEKEVRVHIRWMIRRDMPEVLQTEQESFEFAWTEEDFLRSSLHPNPHASGSRGW